MSHYFHYERFLNLTDEESDKDSSAVWLLPVPLERTTCFMGGTSRGPAALLQASAQLELYDEYIEAEGAAQYGIHTLPVFLPRRDSLEGEIAALREYVAALPLKDRLLVTLGGEHSITPGLVAGMADQVGGDLVLVQIDAHGDLRDEYEGSQWSHACAMRRCLPHVSRLLQLGIRSFGQEEIEFLRQMDRITLWSAETLHRDHARQHLETLRQMITGKKVYLTIDVDGFDPFVFPHTGTPYPGGIGWYEGLDIIRTVARYANVVAFDCVELSAPDSSALGTAHSAAVLVYKTINAIMQARGKITPFGSAEAIVRLPDAAKSKTEKSLKTSKPSKTEKPKTKRRTAIQ